MPSQKKLSTDDQVHKDTFKFACKHADQAGLAKGKATSDVTKAGRN